MKFIRYIVFSLLSIATIYLAYPWIRKPKVFDCFPFMNEFEVLKVRLNELNEVVDYFVLVESIETQRGSLKPLYFEENKHLFEPFLNKIIHVAIRERHPEMQGWDREHFQRNCIKLGLKGRCAANDVVLISDVDEIPRPEAIWKMKGLLNGGAKAVRFHQEIYYYKLNWQHPNGKTHGGEDWFGTVATKYKAFSKRGAQHFRNRREHKDWPLIWEGGWHFSSMGGNDAVRTKIFSVVEGGDQVPSDADLQRTYKTMRALPVDASFPKYVQQNYQRLKQAGFIAEETQE